MDSTLMRPASLASPLTCRFMTSGSWVMKTASVLMIPRLIRALKCGSAGSKGRKLSSFMTGVTWGMMEMRLS